jgi:hypothetical protein
MTSILLYLFPKKRLKFVHISAVFLDVAMLCPSKIVSSDQILSHFRLKIKNQDEFKNKKPIEMHDSTGF